MEKITQEISLIDELGLRNDYQIVAQERGKIVYAHTIYKNWLNQSKKSHKS